jgi:hypothetical protein
MKNEPPTKVRTNRTTFYEDIVADITTRNCKRDDIMKSRTPIQENKGRNHVLRMGRKIPLVSSACYSYQNYAGKSYSVVSNDGGK